MARADESEEPTTFIFPGAWKQEIEERMDSLKQFAESEPAKRFTARYEDEYETVVTIEERRKA